MKETQGLPYQVTAQLTQVFEPVYHVSVIAISSSSTMPLFTRTCTRRRRVAQLEVARNTHACALFRRVA